LKKAIVQFASNSLHLAVTLEILKDAEVLNNKYYYYIWGSNTKYPGRASMYFESLRNAPPKKYSNIIKKANSKVLYCESQQFDRNWVEIATTNFMKQIEEISNIEDLNNLNYLGIKPGSALINELSTITKNIDFEVILNKKLIKLLVESYLQVYDSTIKIIDNDEIDSILIYNGRFFHERAVWDAAKSKNIEIDIYETIRNRYLIQSEGFHSRINNQKIMINHWNNSKLSNQKKMEIGSIYYNELRSDINPFKSKSNASYYGKKPYFVYFSSSDDEYIGLGEEWNKPLGKQINCVKKLQEIFDKQEKFILIIRLHPNLRNKSIEQKLSWRKVIKSKSSIIVDENSNVSSYTLLDGSEGTITFGSTLGLESAFAEKPSLTLADCAYDLLGVVDKADTWEAVEKWLNTGYQISNKEKKIRKNNSCIRGFFLETAGSNFRHSQLLQTGYGSWQALTFMGTKLYTNNFFNHYQKIISKIKFIKIKRLINNAG
jgi:hypothetical protein